VEKQDEAEELTTLQKDLVATGMLKPRTAQIPNLYANYCTSSTTTTDIKCTKCITTKKSQHNHNLIIGVELSL
jgi:hypothetical protein